MMDEEKYMVFKFCGYMSEEWEQESNNLTLEKARLFKKDIQKTHPDESFVIMTIVE